MAVAALMRVSGWYPSGMHTPVFSFLEKRRSHRVVYCIRGSAVIVGFVNPVIYRCYRPPTGQCITARAKNFRLVVTNPLRDAPAAGEQAEMFHMTFSLARTPFLAPVVNV